ncbi:MAG: xanthine dehydrogenase family protein subunit M [Rhodobacteraceae bacterium]|nr:xanthine dehydrogenase family protein subunit M [Paracoccaceae bacterium]
MTYFMPTSLREAVRILADQQVSVIAGGTDYFPSLGNAQPKQALLDVSRIDSLRELSKVADGWRIGAMVSWTELCHADLPGGFDGLKAAARDVGALQIQNAGTIGGNLCNASPAADGVPALLTLDAEVELASSRGSRKMPLSDFISGPRKTALGMDEILSAVHVPDVPDGAVGSFLKHGNRAHLVISTAAVAALVWQDDGGCVAGARVAVGACSPVARRLPALEAALVGYPGVWLAEFAIEHDHMAPLSPISDLRGSAGYRIVVAKVLCRRALAAATKPGGTGNGQGRVG